MFKAIQKIQQFKTQLDLEKIYNGFILLIIFLILVLSSFALYRPVDAQQLYTVKGIAAQSMYPETQDMAYILLRQEHIQLGQYLKLMQAYQVERKKIVQLPAVSEEEYKR